ncbi:MAG TPA: metallophosphoesterase family protein [Aliidongia sp.]|uniref:metallophosphoesterase family protein n=1 Tax=Aliidongia sp. TaxID=1914230 RepID=UPI002DDCBCDC|nr:metallophosphoesterase family protein [Aliidongia sp.]HEV2674279.1 metallophosphoesterase family protein [Aliidongia sp.]
MKIAILADIHGNLPALDAVLADLAPRGIDLTVNLGDIVSGPLFPCETADRLMPLGLPTIRGNHERQLLTEAPERMGPSDRFAAGALRADQKHWLAGLPATLRIGDDILMVHGTPASDLAYFLETVDAAGVRAASASEIEARAADAPARLILCGHTHTPRIVRTADGRLIVNPGSVGVPAYSDDEPFPHGVETGAPHARYGIVEITPAGLAVDLRAVPYDWEAAAAAAEANGRSDWARALRTGRV